MTLSRTWTEDDFVSHWPFLSDVIRRAVRRVLGRRHWPDDSAVDDISSVVAMKALEVLRSGRFVGDEVSMAAYLTRVARFATIDYVRREEGRRRTRTVQLEGEVAERGDGWEGEILREDVSERLRFAVAQLPSELQEIVRMRALEDLTLAQIANRLHRSVASVFRSWKEALAQLREFLSEGETE